MEKDLAHRVYENGIAGEDLTGTWWVYIERDQGRKDMAIGPYVSAPVALEAANESLFVEGELTSRDGGTDCYTTPYEDLPQVAEKYEMVLIDPDDENFFG